MTTVAENFPLSILVAVAVIALCVLLIKLVADAGAKKACAHRELLRDATPSHYQGREADFDERGRPW